MEKSPTLALVMCVKNEEKGLRAAVESAKSICDEIVIAVDTASTDKTLEIARSLTPDVKIFTWPDDFSKMRNYAHVGVKSDWILYLDGHEVLKTPETVKNYLKECHDGILCRIEMDNGTLFSACRLYRNGRQFHGAIHEQLNCEHVASGRDILIQHNRIGGQSKEASAEREKQRNELMPRIMGRQIQEDKKNVRASFHMSLFYQSIGNYRKARKYEKLYLKYSDEPGSKWFMCYNIALGHYLRRHYLRAWLWTCEACKYNPYRWEIADLRGLIFFGQKNWAKAAEFFVESFNANSGDVSFEPKKRNLAITWNFIGECLFNQGKFFEAGEAFRQGKTHCNDLLFKKILVRRADLMLRMAEANKPDLK